MTRPTEIQIAQLRALAQDAADAGQRCASVATRLREMIGDVATQPLRYEIRRNSDGSVDEIVANNATVHLEQMSESEWCLIITVGETQLMATICNKRGARVDVRCEAETR